MDDLTDAQIEAMADKCPGITRHSYILGAKDARAALSTSPAPTQATQDAEQAPMRSCCCRPGQSHPSAGGTAP